MPDRWGGRARSAGYDGRGLLGPGLAAFYLGLIVLIPIAALFWQSLGQGLDAFVAAVTRRRQWPLSS